MNAAALFRQAVEFSMQSSFFEGTVIVIYGTTRHTCEGSQVTAGDNKAKAEECGLTHTRTLEAHILKTAVPRKPATDTDVVEYQGRKYTIDSVEGDDPCSPVWTIDASAPL